MTHLKVYDDSKNYTAVIVKLSNTFALQGLDKLVGVSVFGNTCIIPKDYDLNQLYVFFPAETQLSPQYLTENNLYRNSNYNDDMTQKGYFEDNGRVKAIKLKGNVSTGVLMPVDSLYRLETGSVLLGDEFNELNGVFICKKYIVPHKASGTGTPKQNKVLDELIDSKLFPQHIDTEHLLKNLNRVSLSDNVVISIKLHGTSGRVANTLTKRKLKRIERWAKRFGVSVVEEEYKYVVGSRKVVKSIDFNELKNKNHYYEEDLWTKVSKEHFEGKLHKGEAIYFEIIGKDYTGSEIQKGYTYGSEKPTVYIYRITHINPNGVEIDLTWEHLQKRAIELDTLVVPTIWNGSFYQYLKKQGLDIWAGTKEDFIEKHLKDAFMDKPSVLDQSVIEEGICIRVETYPRPRTYKLKSPKFLLHEGAMADKQIEDVETQN
jgi:hypothetical protein